MTVSCSRRFLSFAAIGSLGFMIDASALALAVHAVGMDPLSGRGISFLAAVTTTWYLNRRVTFRGMSRRPPSLEFTHYVTTQMAGALVNLSVYVLCLATVPVFARVPVVPLAIGSLTGLSVNYTAGRLFVFGHSTRLGIDERSQQPVNPDGANST